MMQIVEVLVLNLNDTFFLRSGDQRMCSDSGGPAAVGCSVAWQLQMGPGWNRRENESHIGY